LSWAELQIALERLGFSCGYIDNDPGSRTTKAIQAYQQSNGLAITGKLNAAARRALLRESAWAQYLIRPEDLAQLQPVPQTVLEKSQATTLGYHSLDELLAERFHTTQAFLRTLNPHVRWEPGVYLRVPAIPPLPSRSVTRTSWPVAELIRISLAERTVRLLAPDGKILAHFPCSIAADKLKRPVGRLTVINFAEKPNYTYDCKLFPEVALREKITGRFIFPPGPNNPVGTAWIGLSLPSYGIHGTPDPENIGRTASHGCFRLTNWNVQHLLRYVRIGLPVEIEGESGLSLIP
jgi:lipoprotein-anchoring transpeptidase ErfK/SrfK